MNTISEINQEIFLLENCLNIDSFISKYKVPFNSHENVEKQFSELSLTNIKKEIFWSQ